MMLSRDDDKRENMEMKGQILKGWVYKGKTTMTTEQTQEEQEQRTHEKKNPKSTAPVSETRFIHSPSIPLSLKHVSYTTDQHPYL